MYPNMHWYPVSSGDRRAYSMFLRHYSARPNRGARKGKNHERYTPPGEHICLMTSFCDALFVWVKEGIRKDNQSGIYCSVFRNEGKTLSSTLILEAEQFAWERWPQERLFTYVDAKKVKSSNPGYCFQMAGWKVCGRSKAKRLILLEKFPE
jgi:hypothetical protein